MLELIENYGESELEAWQNRMRAIYVDVENNLFIFPTGRFENYGGVIIAIDLPQILNHPFTEEALALELKTAMNHCYALEPKDIHVSPLAKLMNVKSYDKTQKSKEMRGYEFLYDRVIKLGKAINDKDLMEAFNIAFFSCLA